MLGQNRRQNAPPAMAGPPLAAEAAKVLEAMNG
jgi:hypothetical protein